MQGQDLGGGSGAGRAQSRLEGRNAVLAGQGALVAEAVLRQVRRQLRQVRRQQRQVRRQQSQEKPRARVGSGRETVLVRG